MARIILYTSGTLGDHLPFIALGQALAADGHDVQLAINKAMHDRARLAGLDVIHLGDEVLGPAEAREYAWAWDYWKFPEPSSHPDAPLLKFEDYMVQVNRLMAACGKADLLISTSIRLLGYIVAHTLEIPWLTVSLNPYSFWQPDKPEQVKAQYVLRQKEYHQFSALADQAFEALGSSKRVPPWSPGWLFAPHVLLACSRHFAEPNLTQFQPLTSIDMTGFWFYQDPKWAGWRPDEALRRFCEPSDPDQKPLVLSFSSQPLLEPGRILARHARAAAHLNRPLLVQKGWAGFSKRDLPADLNSEKVFFCDFVPHDWLFSRAACTIQHGGIGSIARALVQGCPVLVEPFGNDQFFNANQVLRLGAGAALSPYEAGYRELSQAIGNRLLNDACRERTRKVGEQIRKENGLHNACKMIRRYLNRMRPNGRYPKVYSRFSPPLTPRSRKGVPTEDGSPRRQTQGVRAHLMERGIRLADTVADLDACRAALAQSGRSPRISCLMVTKDRLPLAQRAFECFQKQSYASKELVIVDDSPSDDLQDWIKQFSDERRSLPAIPSWKSDTGRAAK